MANNATVTIEKDRLNRRHIRIDYVDGRVFWGSISSDIVITDDNDRLIIRASGRTFDPEYMIAHRIYTIIEETDRSCIIIFKVQAIEDVCFTCYLTADPMGIAQRNKASSSNTSTKKEEPKITIEEEVAGKNEFIYYIRLNYADGRAYRGNLCPDLGLVFKLEGLHIMRVYPHQQFNLESVIAVGRYEITESGDIIQRIALRPDGFYSIVVACKKIENSPAPIPVPQEKPKGATVHYMIYELDIELTCPVLIGREQLIKVDSVGAALFWGEKLASLGDTRGLDILSTIYDEKNQPQKALDVLLRGVKMEKCNSDACHTRLSRMLSTYVPYMCSCDGQNSTSNVDPAPQIFDDRIEWHNKEGEHHRDGDEPARIWDDGSCEWWKNGQMHRDGDKPARIWATGSHEWWKNGQRHRDGDEPAIVCADGARSWYKNGQHHRDGDNPAVIWANGDREWWKNGQKHRDEKSPSGETLPARIWANGSCEWWRNGQLHRDEKSPSGETLPAIIWANGSREWWRNGQLHRDGDEPARIWADGSREWYKNGQLHRDGDEPAQIRADGTRIWCQNDQTHRATKDSSNGHTMPAVTRPDGTREWWQHGKPYRTDRDSTGLLLPTFVIIDNKDTTFYWFDDGQLHRDEKGPDGTVLPAIISDHDKSRQWWNRGKLHREEKDSNGRRLPAIIHADGRCENWLNGVRFA